MSGRKLRDRQRLRETGEKLQAVRSRRGLTQEEAASAASMHQSALSKVEKGLRHLSLHEFEDLAALYGIDIVWPDIQTQAQRLAAFEREEARQRALDDY